MGHLRAADFSDGRHHWLTGHLPGSGTALLSLGMNREKIRRSSIAQLSSLRLSNFLIGTSLVLGSVLLFEWNTSLNTWLAVTAFAGALVSFYQATLAWLELKRRERRGSTQPDGDRPSIT
jgi:hypothetical protein